MKPIQDLKNEVARAKGINPKPQIRPSKLETPKEKTEKEGEKEGGKRPGSAKKMKTKDLTIHNEIVIAPDHIPEGAVLKGLQNICCSGHPIGSKQYPVQTAKVRYSGWKDNMRKATG